MTKSVYKYVSEMNTAYGNPVGLAVEDDKVLKESAISKLLSQARNIYGEIDELRDDGFNVLLEEPTSKTGRKETFDAMADILVFLHGVGHFINKEPVIFSEEKFENIPSYYLVGDENSEIEKLEFGTEDFAKKYYNMIRHHTDLLISSIYERDLNSILFYFKQIDVDVKSLFNILKKEGYTVEELVRRVTESNLSKLCRNEEELEKTLKFYHDLELEVHSGESPLLQDNGKPFLVVYSSKTQKDKNGKAYQANKALKNTVWFEPDIFDF